MMKKQTQIIVRISDEEKNKLKTIAHSKEMNLSEYIRHLIKSDLQVNENILTVMQSFK